MGVISNLVTMFFGGRRNLVKETLEVLRPNAEAQDSRGHTLDMATLNQLAAEFQPRQNRSWFDGLVDGLNRLPRPLMIIGVLGMLIYTPIDPVRMAQVFTAWALIPAGMWAVITAIVGFYFNGREQLKDHDFQAELAETLARAPKVIASMEALQELRHDSPGVADPGPDASLAVSSLEPDANPAVAEWREAARA